jgi:hypothetical protein
MPAPFSVRLVSAAVALCSVSTVGILGWGAALGFVALMTKAVEALDYLPLGWGMRHMGVLEVISLSAVAPVAVWAGLKLYRHAVTVESQMQKSSETEAETGSNSPAGGPV